MKSYFLGLIAVILHFSVAIALSLGLWAGIIAGLYFLTRSWLWTVIYCFGVAIVILGIMGLLLLEPEQHQNQS